MRGIKDEKLKQEAIKLRRLGQSYSTIENKLKVAKATLSGWLGGLRLPKSAMLRISTRKKNHLKNIRPRAQEVKSVKRAERYVQLQRAVIKDFGTDKFDVRRKELLLAMLYLGEGFKGKFCIGLGNSNPEIMRLFVKLVREVYTTDESKFRCFLHLRMDQMEEKEKSFWSRQVGVPLVNFRKTQFDKRTLGRKTWQNYHGVCVVYYYDAAIDKRLSEVQRMIIKKVLGL